MAPKAESLDAFKKIAVLADKIMRDQKKINPRFDLEIGSNLPLAIKNKDGAKIQLYLTALEAVLKEIEVSLDDTRTALIRAHELETSDEEFVAAHLSELDQVTSKISDAQASLTKQFRDGGELKTQAQEALDSQQNTEDKAFQQLAEFDKWINDEKKELKETFAKSDQTASKAKAAFEARDAKSLADAQKAMSALNIDVVETSYNGQEAPIKEFIQKVEASGFEAKSVSELKKGAEEALSIHKANKVYLDQMLAQQKMVADFKIAPVDVKKAEKALNLTLDAKTEPKLAKALTGTRAAMERQLDALAKELKLKTNGKQMLAALDKADLL